MNQLPEEDRHVESLERVQQALETGSLDGIRTLFAGMHPAEVALVLESLPPAERDAVWPAIDPGVHAEVFAEAGDAVRAANLATAFVAAWAIGRFEGTIQELVALAVLMPVVASMGGIAGSQTLTIVIRALALGQVNAANFGALMSRELWVGVINGLVWAAVVGLVAGLWFGSLGLALVAGAALSINMLARPGLSVQLELEREQRTPDAGQHNGKEGGNDGRIGAGQTGQHARCETERRRRTADE